MKQEMKGWQWHQLDHMQIICTLLQTDNDDNTSSLILYRPDELPAVQPTVSKHWRHWWRRKPKFRLCHAEGHTSGFMVRRSHTDSLPTLGALSSPVGLVVSSRPIALHVNCRPWGLLAIATILEHRVTCIFIMCQQSKLLTEQFYLSIYHAHVLH